MQNVRELLMSLNNEFCAEQLKEFMKDPVAYQTEATNLIDDVAMPIKGFLYGLNLAMGIDGVVGANVLLSMLIKFEARQESLKDGKKLK